MKSKMAYLLVTTALVMAVAPPVMAQVAPSDAEESSADAPSTSRRAKSEADGTVVVTGTRIVRPNNKSAAPIVSVTAAEIEAQGAVNIEEVLNRMPQVQPNAEQNYADSDGRQRVKLRNLGFERTLTLVDGLRLGLQNGLDVGIIPSALVERIDVLSGGASSVYGSDAVAGVINFVLKKNFDGISLNANYNFYNHYNRENAVTTAARSVNFPAPVGLINDGGRADITLSAGKTLFGGALNVTGFVNYRNATLVTLADRATSSCEVTQAVKDGPLVCSRATFTPAGTIIPQSGPLGFVALANNPDGSGTFVRINTLPGTYANPYDESSFQRNFNRINAGGFVSLKLSDAFELSSSTLYYRDKSRSPQLNRTFNFGAYGSTPYQVNCDNPFLSASQGQTLCGPNAGIAGRFGAFDLRYRFDNFPTRDVEYVNTGIRQTVSARGRLFDDVWNYELSGMFSRNRATTDFMSYASFDRVNRSLNVVNRNGTPTCVSVIDGTDPACVPFNAFRPFNSSAALQNYLFIDPDGRQGSVSRLWQGLLSIGADLGKYGITSPFATQGIAFAVGAEYRDEKFTFTADEQYRTTNGGSDSSRQQNIKEANVELQVPLVEKQSWTQLLQVNAGYRISKYSTLVGKFDTWKLEGLWAPINDITFRGGYNKAQRSGTVIELVQANEISFTTEGSRNDPCATLRNPDYDPADPNKPQFLAPSATLQQCRNTGLPDNLYGSRTLDCNDACTIRNGGFQLEPETAYTQTYGVVLRPRFLPGLTLSIDRFKIDVQNSIGYAAAAGFLSGCLTTGLEYYCRGVVRNPGTFTLSSPTGSRPTSGFIAQGTVNAYKVFSQGWDFQGQYELGLGKIGRLGFSFNGSLPTRLGGQGAPDSKKNDCRGYYGPGCGEGFPKWTHTLRTTYTTPDRVASVSVNWRYIDPMTITTNNTNPSNNLGTDTSDDRTTYNRLSAYNYIDLATSFDIARRFSLRFSVNNLFDKDPPLIPGSRNLDFLLRANTVFRYDFLGRQINIGATTNF